MAARRTGAKVVRRVLGPLAAALGVRLYDVFYGERPIEEVPPEIPTAVPLVVRAVQADDLALVAARIPKDDAARFASAFAAGDVGLVATCNGDLAGFIWASLAEVALPDVPICALPPGGAYAHHGFVVAEHRGKRLVQTIARALHLELRARGCTFTCRLIDRVNHASLVATERGGIHYRWAPVIVLPGAGAFFLLGRPGALRGGRLATPRSVRE